MAKASVRDRLPHIHQSINAVKAYWCGKTFGDFEGSEPFRSAAERHLLIIAEAVKYIPESGRAAHPQIPWRDIIGIGNIFRHGYDTIDHIRICNVVQFDLPALKTAIDATLTNAQT